MHLSQFSFKANEMADELAHEPLIMADPHWFRGAPYPGMCKQETLEALKHVQVYDDDIYVAGYPKSGRPTLRKVAFLFTM